MSLATFAFISANVAFAAIFMITARLLLGRRTNPLLWAYVIVTVLFVYTLTEQEYSSGVGMDFLLLSHVLMFAYLGVFLLVARKRSGTLHDLIDAVSAVPNQAIALVIGAWLTMRLYLIVSYGPAGLMFSRSMVVQSAGYIEMSSLDVALASITTIFLLGAFFVVTMRLATGQAWRSPLQTVAAAIALVLMILTNESPVGSRRLLLVLTALWLAVIWLRSGGSALIWIKRHLTRLAIALAVVAGLSFYYQHIRHNDPSEILAATGVSDLLKATANFLFSFNTILEETDTQHLRSGPFDFFARVVYASVVDSTSSQGEATTFSLALAIPRTMYPGEKPVGDVDEVLLQAFEINPQRPVLVIDYPTSLPAIGVADFGLLGVVPAAFLLGACFTAVGQALRFVKRFTLTAFPVFGCSIILICSQEGGLTAIVAAMRDAGVAICVILVGQCLYTLVRRQLWLVTQARNVKSFERLA